MILSEDRQTHIAHVAIDGIWNDDLVDYNDEDKAIQEGTRAVVEFVKNEEDIDEACRSRILAQKKGILEGSREFDVLYKKYYEEESRKRGG